MIANFLKYLSFSFLLKLTIVKIMPNKNETTIIIVIKSLIKLGSTTKPLLFTCRRPKCKTKYRYYKKGKCTGIR
jgi:hypothetical protein